MINKKETMRNLSSSSHTFAASFERSSALAFLTFCLAVLSTLAIGHSDTTLAPVFVTQLIVKLKYVCVIGVLLLADYRHLRMPNLMNLLLPFILFVMNVFNTPSGVSMPPSILSVLLLLAFALLDDVTVLRVFCYYRCYLLVMAILGIIAFVAFIFQVRIPYEIIPYYTSNENMLYANYYFSYILFYGVNDGIRLCGLFNEPGYFGTFLALMIIIERCRSNWRTLVLFIAGCFTLSMAFFSLLVVGICLLRCSKLQMLVLFTSLLVFVFVILPNMQFENPVLQQVVERFQYDEKSGKLTGDNRTSDDFEKIEAEFYRSNHLLLGMGTGYCHVKRGVVDTSSFRTILVEWGFLGILVTYVNLFAVAYYIAHKDKMTLVFLFCFILSVYQRPNIFMVGYYTLLFGGILFMKQQQGDRYNL